MKVHERNMIQTKANYEFKDKYYKLSQSEDITYDKCVNALSQTMINLSLDEKDRTLLGSLHESIQKAFEEVDKKYELTYAESIQILTDCISTDMKYLKRYERHGNYDDPAGLE